MSDIRREIARGRSRYNLLAPLYDPLVGLLERRGFSQWRALLWSKAEGQRVLEVGVGTGRSFSYYPSGITIDAIDYSWRMLDRARKKAEKGGIRVNLQLMDVQQMTFRESSFDAVVSSLVFCAVPDPLRGLNEVRRVLRPGGKLVMLEHVIGDTPLLARFMKLVSPPIRALTGEDFVRDTGLNVQKSGLMLEKVSRLSRIFRLIEARKEKTGPVCDEPRLSDRDAGQAAG
jgi:phosphatidylethanolamine/phosphatidyl-N-methylethanolamine N-methyltransferase